jgi:hypothetical protein
MNNSKNSHNEAFNYPYGNSADSLSLMSLVQNQSFIYSIETNFSLMTSSFLEFSERDILFVIDNLKLPAKVIPGLSKLFE